MKRFLAGLALGCVAGVLGLSAWATAYELRQTGKG